MSRDDADARTMGFRSSEELTDHQRETAVREKGGEPEPRYSLEEIADACVYAEVPDSKYESIAISLAERASSPVGPAEPTALREALAELVACKDLKERIEANFGARPEQKAEYARRQPLAWEAARAALAAPVGPETDAPDLRHWLKHWHQIQDERPGAAGILLAAAVERFLASPPVLGTPPTGWGGGGVPQGGGPGPAI